MEFCWKPRNVPESSISGREGKVSKADRSLYRIFTVISAPGTLFPSKSSPRLDIAPRSRRGRLFVAGNRIPATRILLPKKKLENFATDKKTKSEHDAPRISGHRGIKLSVHNSTSCSSPRESHITRYFPSFITPMYFSTS